MRKAVLTRLETSDEGTFGELISDSGFTCRSLELPWRGNAKGRSCIPAGVYVFRWRTDSPAHGECYQADPDAEAPGRDNIQIHAANWAGDQDKGFKAELLGCIAPGKAVSVMEHAPGKPQRGVTESRATLEKLVKDLNREPFELAIKWAGPSPEEDVC